MYASEGIPFFKKPHILSFSHNNTKYHREKNRKKIRVGLYSLYSPQSRSLPYTHKYPFDEREATLQIYYEISQSALKINGDNQTRFLPFNFS
jgi:hypothetical protein